MTEERNRHFCLNDDVEIVYGPTRAAIYNLRSGDVYSVDEDGKKVLCDLENLVPVGRLSALDTIHQESIDSFLDKLETNSIGRFNGKPVTRKCNDYSKPPLRKLDVLWMELTDRCNLKCVHCYAGIDGKQADTGAALSQDLWKKVVTDASSISCKRITFIGGEPLLKPELLLALSRLAVKLEGIDSFEVFTNATVFAKKVLDELISIGTCVASSVYSMAPAVHERISQSEGSFKKTMRTLDYLASKGVPLRIAVIAMRENQDDVENTVAALRERYPDAEVDYDVVRPMGRGCSTSVYPTRKFMDGIRDESDFSRVDRETFWVRHHGHSCLWGKLVVGCSGKVRPCIMDNETQLGDVHEQSLLEIVESENARRIWGHRKESIEECSACEFRYACVDCLPRTRQLTGSIYNKPRECMYDPLTGKWKQRKGGSPT